MGVQNQKICCILANMTLYDPQIGKCCKQIGTIALEKVLWGIEFIKIGYWVPKEQKLQLCMPY